MRKLAICLKTYIDEDALDAFLEGEIKTLTQKNVRRKGNKYFVIDGYYNKEYYELLNQIK